MLIGVPKEIKDNEYGVAMTPAGVKVLKEAGHTVVIQRTAGVGSGISDDEYIKAGGGLVDTVDEVYKRADLIVKVKEPTPQEYPLLREGQILFTFLHLAGALELTRVLMERGVVAITYETIELPDGSLPILTPMSEIAGRLAPQIGAYYLMKSHGGEGTLLGGIPGVERGKVTIIGGGVVGTNSAKVALGLGADVTIMH